MRGWLGSPAWALLLFLPFTFAQTSSYPTNSSELLYTPGEEIYYLESTQFSIDRIPLLIRELSIPGTDADGVNITGTLRKVTPQNYNKLSSGDVAYVSCDASAYPGDIGVQDVVQKVTSNFPFTPATVLYTTVSDLCNFSAPMDSNQYRQVFSVMGAGPARELLEKLDSANSPGSGRIIIVSSSPPKQTGRADSQPAFPDYDTGGSNRNSAPNTPSSSVAMIILYSVTGIITALFLAVIIIGTIRAHRNPERYGPRNVAGRPRQSRARGIARAVLETLPIVKFGDLDDARNDPKTDVEMASHDGEQDDRAKEPREERVSGVIARTQSAGPPRHAGTDEQPREQDVSRVPEEAEEGQIGPAIPSRSVTPNPHDSPAETLVCPICTDEFVKGQDVRLLPCDHKFHPDCIDPWLVNVSGTCPLCRIDLAPAAAEEAERTTSVSESQQSPESVPAPETGTQSRRASRHHRRLSEYLHDTFLPAPRREMTVEQRLDAVRRLRSAHSLQNERTARGALVIDNSDETGRRETLTARLRDRFRIRTRRHGEELREESGDGPGPSTSGT